MAILTGHEIRKQIAAGNIKVSPYREENVEPNSLDVTLGAGVCIYTGGVSYDHLGSDSHAVSWSITPHTRQTLSVSSPNQVAQFQMDSSGWLLKPGVLYLMHTEEELYAPNHVMTLGGKSSLGRLGVAVHITAGHGETGFRGQFTLEVTAIHDILIYPGMKIGQILFETIEGKAEDYKDRGSYVDGSSVGAQPSLYWRKFNVR